MMKTEMRVQGSSLWVVNRDSRWGFEFSRLNFLLSRAFSQLDKRQKSLELLMGSVTFKYNMKVILKLWTLNYVDCIPFSCILSILFTTEPTNLKNLILEFAKNMIKLSLIWMYLTT